MVLYNLSLVLNHEIIKVYDNAIQSTVYVGSSEYIPFKLRNELVHNVKIVNAKHLNRVYLLITIN